MRPIPKAMPTSAMRNDSRRTMLTMASLGCAHGLEDADLAGALEDGGVHGEEDDQEADERGDEVTTFNAMSKPGMWSGVIMESHSCMVNLILPGSRGYSTLPGGWFRWLRYRS
jgi:hypothetical protein